VAETRDGNGADARQYHLPAENIVTGDRPQLARLEAHLGRLLVTGVTISALLLAIGLGMWLFDPGRGSALWLLNAGLLVLMATPILRVIVSFAEYTATGQWFFATVTILVLLELSVTLLVALSKR
jgi:uncharacterized membrane protein